MPVFVGPNNDDSRLKSDRVGFAVSTANPNSASTGDSYFNSADNQLKVYNGSDWDSVGSGGGTFEAVASGTLSDGSTVVINTDGTVSVVDSTNLTSSNFVGFSDGAYTNGQTATVQIAGSVDDAQVGLTTGQKYFVQNDGTLSTSAGNPSVEAGTAVSASKIIIKG